MQLTDTPPEAVVERRPPRGFRQLVKVELLMFLREPAAMFFTLVFPLALLLFTGVAYGKSKDDTNGLRMIDENVPQIIATIAVNLGVLGVAVNLAESRARGILRRYKLAPVPFWWFWLSQVIVGVLMFALATALLLGVVQATLGVNVKSPVSFLLITLFGLAPAFTMGVVLGSLRMPVRTVQIVGTGVFFWMFLGSGAALPRGTFPSWLRAVSSINPMTPIVDASERSYLGHSLVPALPWLGLVLLFTLGTLVFARRMSRWEVER